MMAVMRRRLARVRATPQSGGLREWIRDHDDKWLFVALYLGLSVGLSVFVSLFWLVVVVGVHFLLECMRQAYHWADRRAALLHALWEVKLDIGLVVLAFTLVLYIDTVMGVVGLQSATRAAAATRASVRIGARAAAWERNIRTFLLTVDELVRVGYAFVMVKRRATDGGAEAAPAEAALAQAAPAGMAAAPALVPAAAVVVTAPASARRTPAWRGRWGTADRIGVALATAGVVLILLAPFITPHDWGSATSAVFQQLRPFRAS